METTPSASGQKETLQSQPIKERVQPDLSSNAEERDDAQHYAAKRDQPSSGSLAEKYDREAPEELRK